MPGRKRRFASNSGRSSERYLPFFNLQGPAGGFVLAVGWTGAWSAEFLHDDPGTVMVRAGMERTHFRLRPGESVRTPRIVILRWIGDSMIRGHNLFRRMMLDHYVRKRDGVPIHPPVAHNTCATLYVRKMGYEGLNEANQRAVIRRAGSLGVEAYWMDAYWFPLDKSPWNVNVGNWFPRPKDFPRGLKPLGDAAHESGMQFVLWFEPERAQEGTRIARVHPGFFLRLEDSPRFLLDLGMPMARRYVTDLVDRCIKEWGVDLYRQDFNILPLSYWREHDAPDRQGITEMRHVEGLYRFWSDLLERNPGLAIDNTASGGRRIDIETCSRSFPLWRSDRNDFMEGLKGPAHWPRMGLADQVMVTGLALYIPFQSGPVWDVRPYGFRSAMTSSIVLYGDIDREGFPDDLARQAFAELKSLRPCFLGDLYPLLPLTTSQKDWYAYQLHRSDLDAGCALFFRRPDSPVIAIDSGLNGIDPDARYRVRLAGETYHCGPWQERSGRGLLELEVEIREKPGSALLRYERIAN